MTPPPKPSPSFLDRLRRFDPTVLPIAAAAIVLVVTAVWLFGRPLPQPVATGPDPRTTQELAALGARQERVEALAARVAALEGRAAPGSPDLAPLRAAIAALQDRPTAASPDLAPLRDALTAAESRAEAAERQAAALGQRLADLTRELESRPRFDPASVAPREALQQLAGRVENLAREAQASATQRDQRQAATDQAIGAFASRVAANEVGLAQRGQAIEQLAGRVGQIDQQAGGRIAQLEQQLAGRLAGLERQFAERGQAIEQQAQRLAALEGTTQRLTTLEGRAARLAALESLQMALEAGQPLGPALRPLADPPRALARFAETAPPTLAQLRLGFEDAARAALAASEPARAGATLLEGAAARLQGLVTVRRGEEVLWGDAAAAEIERARRALEAGDLDAALRPLGRLSPPAREAMAGWIGQAEALVAARDALRQMAAG